MDYQPNNITDCVADAQLALEKGRLILGDLTTTYPFDGDKKDYIQKWTFECGRITTFMEIALDYMYEASKRLERAEQLRKGAAAIE